MTENTVTGQKYKTGDPHPVHRLMSFVEYDENGGEVWTSTAIYPEAPFRLAAASKQRQHSDKSTQPRTQAEGIERSGLK